MRFCDLPGRPRQIALGFFDGVHIGHQALIGALNLSYGLESMAFSFENHPLIILSPKDAPAYLTTAGEKEALLRHYGAQNVLLVPFDREMAQMPAEDFAHLLFTALDAKRIVVGSNYRFGAGAKGNAALLCALGEARGVRVQIVPDVSYKGALVSSTRIRCALSNGSIEEACAMLGRPYTLSGQVLHGRHIGRQLRFPTANLSFDPQRALPMDGVYAGFAELSGQQYPCVINVGASPTVHTAFRTIEAHLIDFGGDLYQKKMTLSFRRFLRPEINLPSLDALRDQIARDVADAKRLL